MSVLNWSALSVKLFLISAIRIMLTVWLKQIPNPSGNFINKTASTSKNATSYFFEGNTSCRPTDVCNLFASFFSSVYKMSSDPSPTYNFNTQLNLFLCKFSSSEVENKLVSLDKFKGSGPENIPAWVLKYTVPLWLYLSSLLYSTRAYNLVSSLRL